MNTGAKLMDTMKESMHRAQGSVHGIAHVDDAVRARARAKLRTTLHTARMSLRNGRNRVTTSARRAADTTDLYVRRNPWSAIGIAAATGAAIGMLLRLRTRTPTTR